MEALMLVATRGGPTMLARIGVMRAPHRNVERVFNPDRKETHSSLDALTRYFEILSSDWPQIVGKDLGEATRPLLFSGKKARRLLIQANAETQPEWGGWFHLSHVESERRVFTKFRAAINEAIAPHVVDHVDFIQVEK